MPNAKGWFTKEEAVKTGLPYFIPSSRRWTSRPYEFAVLLSKSRCEHFGKAIADGEDPVAFRYNSSAGIGGSRDEKSFRYVPLYDRTQFFQENGLDVKNLFPYELMKLEVSAYFHEFKKEIVKAVSSGTAHHYRSFCFKSIEKTMKSEKYTDKEKLSMVKDQLLVVESLIEW